MAKNFNVKSMSELKNIAKSYGTHVEGFDFSSTSSSYDIARGSSEEFNNIINFLYNSTILDKVEMNNSADVNPDSKTLSELLLRYYEQELSDEDIIRLDKFVNEFNKKELKEIEQEPFIKLFDLNEFTDTNLYKSSFVDHIKKYIITEMRELAHLYDKKQIESEAEPISFGEWVIEEYDKDADYEAFGYPIGKGLLNSLFTGTEIVNFLERNNLLDPIILGHINELVKEGMYSLNSGLENKEDSKIEFNRVEPEEDRTFSYYVSTSPNSESLEMNGYIIPFFTHNSDGEITVLNIFDINEGEWDAEKLKKINNQDIYEKQENAFNLIVDRLYKGIYDENYSEEDKFIYSKTLDGSIFTEWVSELAELMLDRYLINAVLRVSPQISNSGGSPNKRTASTFEAINTGNDNPLLFIDIKDIKISDSPLLIKYLKEEYGEEENTFKKNIFSNGTKYNENTSGEYLTLTVIYKELNDYIADRILQDSQDFILSRMKKNEEGYIERLISSTNTDYGVSFRSDIHTMFRTYEEANNLMKIDPEGYASRNIYTNSHRFLTSDESDIVAYFIGNRLSKDIFITDYGSKENERNEIASFLSIYKSTRDYFYRVLLNKAYATDPEYKLFERLFISVVSVERFISSKIENIHNVEFFNDDDIYNFLESYGLSVLNNDRYNFSQITHNFKLNTIRYFNDLVRLKGSRDVVRILTRILDVGDTEVEMGKFMIFENTDKDGERPIQFLETSYESDNMTKEIYDSYGHNPFSYSDFIKPDRYWTEDNVPEESLKQYGLNITDTKYMSLTLIERIFERFVQSRLLMSVIDNLEEAFGINNTSTLFNVFLDSGSLFSGGTISMYEVYKLIKIMFKSIFLLSTGDDQKEEEEATYLGLNVAGISEVENEIKKLLSRKYDDDGNITDIENKAIWKEFTEIEKKISGETETPPVYRYNKYIPEELYVDYFRSNTPKREYQKLGNDEEKRTQVYSLIRDHFFTSHKFYLGIQKANSGVLFDTLFDGMSLIKIMDNIQDSENKEELRNDLWVEIIRPIYDRTERYGYDTTRKEIEGSDIYYNAIEKIIDFPIRYYNGMVNNFQQYPSLFNNKETIDFIQLIMNKLFIVKGKNTMVVKEEELNDLSKGSIKFLEELGLIQGDEGSYEFINLKSENITTLQKDNMIHSISEKMLETVDYVRTIFASEQYKQFSLTIPDEENRVLEFIGDLTRVFLSYTSEIYYTRFRKVVGSRSESMEYSEGIKHRLTHSKEDYMFYDEKVIFEKVKKVNDTGGSNE